MSETTNQNATRTDHTSHKRKGTIMTRRRSRRPQNLEDRYLGELGNGGQRDDMLQALCRIADQLQRIADRMALHDTTANRQSGQETL